MDRSSSKVRGLDGCSSLGTFGDYSQFLNRECEVILVEGMFDYLSALERQLHRGDTCVVGVHGISNMPKILGGLASTRKVRSFKFYPQNDKAGMDTLERCKSVALNWKVPTHVHKLPGDVVDLNDALLAGKVT